MNNVSFFLRLILTTVLVTSKMYNDTYYTNQYIASVGGVTLQNINQLERFFMTMIDWHLFITLEDFAFYERGLSGYQHVELPSAAALAHSLAVASSSDLHPASQIYLQ